MNANSITRSILIAAVLFALIVSIGVAQKKYQSDVLKTSAGDLKITFIGHGTLMFEFGGKVIHVDPSAMFGDFSALPKADLILITHEHGDHWDAKTVQLLSKPDTKIFINQGLAKQLPAASVMKNGDSQTAAGVKIEAVPAYNPGKPFHPQGNGNGYLLTFADKRVLVAGDTENVPEIKALKNIDVAFLPMNLPFTMTPEQVADAAKAVQPKILYPYHFGDANTNALIDLLKDQKGIEVRIRELK
jgi:L-ascorbate metabolism protein UlaG (beta-lactamase superfamily)